MPTFSVRTLLIEVPARASNTSKLLLLENPACIDSQTVEADSEQAFAIKNGWQLLDPKFQIGDHPLWSFPVKDESKGYIHLSKDDITYRLLTNQPVLVAECVPQY